MESSLYLNVTLRYLGFWDPWTLEPWTWSLGLWDLFPPPPPPHMSYLFLLLLPTSSNNLQKGLKNI